MAVIWNKNIKELTGEVVGDTVDMTRVVMVKSVRVHPLYKKRFMVRKKYYAHDTKNVAKLWDVVKIRESKPISKTKRWVLIEVL